MIVLALYALSGAAGLILESVFLRQLAVVIGSTTTATTVVLAAFLGGLAAGAALFGRIADRSASPLRMYGLLELGAGISGAAVVALLGPGRASLLALLRMAGSGTTGRIAEIALSVVLLAIPAALLGGTFPALARLRARDPERATASLGALYGVNTAGGALGAFVAGFFLFEAIGIAASGFAAATVAIAVGLAALALAGSAGALEPGDAAPAARRPSADPIDARLRSATLAATALGGAAMLGCEVVWTRLLVLPMRSFGYSFSLMLALFLLGLVIGALFLADFGGRIRQPALVLGVALAASGAYVAISLLWLPALLSPPEATSFLGILSKSSLRAALIVLPPTALSGIAFPLAVRIVGGGGAGIGRGAGSVYAANTMGSIVGAAVAGLLLLPLLGAPRALAVLAVVSALAGGVVLVSIRPARLVVRAVALVALVVCVACTFQPTSRFVDAFLRASRGSERIGKLLFFHEGATDTVAVVTKEYGFLDPGAKSLITNAVAMSATVLPVRRYMAAEGHLPVLLAQGRERALAVGVGTGITLAAVVSHPEVAHVDAVELSEGVLRALRSFDDENRRADLDPRVRVIHDDGRRFLERTRESYDIVTVEPPPPIVAGATHLYSLDFYRAIRARLRAGGVVAQWLPLHAQSLESARMTARTFLEAFPHVRLALPSVRDAVLLGSDAPLRLDWERVRAAYRAPEILLSLRGAALETPEALVATFLLDRDAVARWAGAAPILSDERPRMEFFRLQAATVTDAQIGTLLTPEQAGWGWIDGLDGDALARIENENRALRNYLLSEVREDFAIGLEAARGSLGTEFFRYRLGCSSNQIARLTGGPESAAPEAAKRLEHCSRLALPPLSVRF